MSTSVGVETFVDGAHAYAHFPFTRDQIGVDYYGTSLHKWLLAPIGTGFLYVRKDKTMTLKREDYSVNGRLMRTTLYPKYVSLEDKLLPSQILIVDEINKGERSQITMAEQSVEKLPDKVFSKAFLEQVNR